MIRRPRHFTSLLPLCALLLALSFTSGCNRPPSAEEKALRAEVRKALRDRAYDQAVPLAQQLVATAPGDDGAWARLVRAQLGAGDVAAAKQTLGEWRAKFDQPSRKWDALAGDIASRERDYTAAVRSWSRALSNNPKNLAILRKLAHAHRALGETQEEEAILTIMLEINEEPGVLMRRALNRRRQHRWSDALDDFHRAQQLDAGDPEVRRGARLFERLGKFLSEIRKLDARLATRPEDDQLLADRALLFLRSEDAELALQDAAAAAQLAAWTVRPKLFQCIALIELGREAECASLGVDPLLRLESLTSEFLQTVSRLDAEISVERNNAQLYVTRAWHLNEIGQPTLALADSGTALSHEPDLANAHIESGYALMKLRRPDDAFVHIRRATELGAAQSTAWQYRGELEMARGDHAAAIESLTRSIQLEPSPTALQKRAECYQHVGLIAKADEDRRAYENLAARGLN